MFMKDHCGGLSHCINILLQKLRQMSSKSQHLKPSGRIPSGPALYPVNLNPRTLHVGIVSSGTFYRNSCAVFIVSFDW